ncbi:MAG TPA: hypothetical protein VEG39_08495 [Clostridia bacterium]|nr:hypothetical protein [Clostridia bacterium]
MMRNKQFIAGFLTCLILLSAIFITGFAEGISVLLNPYPILLNGQPVEVEAYNVNGRTFLSLGDMVKLVGGTAKLNEVTKQIEISMLESEVATMDTVITQTDNKVKLTPDGIEARIYDLTGQFVINTGRFRTRYRDTEYQLITNMITGEHKLMKNDQVILDNLQIIEGTYYIDYDYYCNTILPLLK